MGILAEVKAEQARARRAAVEELALSGSSEVTTKRGLALSPPEPGSHSALPTTRRARAQLSRVDRVKFPVPATIRYLNTA